MATKIKLKLNHDGFRALLTSSGVQSLVLGQAEKIAARCGDGYEASTFRANFGGGRIAAVVRPTTYEALVDEAENKTLEKAVGRG